MSFFIFLKYTDIYTLLDYRGETTGIATIFGALSEASYSTELTVLRFYYDNDNDNDYDKQHIFADMAVHTT